MNESAMGPTRCVDLDGYLNRECTKVIVTHGLLPIALAMGTAGPPLTIRYYRNVQKNGD